jgi:hypothetical protein
VVVVFLDLEGLGDRPGPGGPWAGGPGAGDLDLGDGAGAG